VPSEESRQDAKAPRGKGRAFPPVSASWRLGGSLLCFLAACGGAQPRPAPAPRAQPIVAATVPSAPPAPSSEEAAPGHRRVALRFELNGRRFPLPVVHGTIAGQPVWMLVDTGANSHVIASWVARRAKLPMRALGDVGSDHTGRAVSAYSVEHPAVVVDGWGPLADGPTLVTDVPGPIERLGIGAFVSPQRLAGDDDGVVLDLAAREMWTAPWDEARRALDERPGVELAPRGVRVCEDDGSAIRGLAFVLPASIDGHPAELLLDTGAHRTDLLTTSRPGRLLAGRARPSREAMYAASGLVRATVVRGARVRIGELALRADVDLVPGVADPVCARDGVVSMDALGSCTLLFGHKTVRGRCVP